MCAYAMESEHYMTLLNPRTISATTSTVYSGWVVYGYFLTLFNYGWFNFKATSLLLVDNKQRMSEIGRRTSREEEGSFYFGRETL